MQTFVQRFGPQLEPLGHRKRDLGTRQLTDAADESDRFGNREKRSKSILSPIPRRPSLAPYRADGCTEHRRQRLRRRFRSKLCSATRELRDMRVKGKSSSTARVHIPGSHEVLVEPAKELLSGEPDVLAAELLKVVSPCEVSRFEAEGVRGVPGRLRHGHHTLVRRVIG